MEKNKSQSHFDYKGYKVRLTFARNNGAKYEIFKVVGEKWLGIRTEQWSFVDPYHLEQRAFNYIDNFNDRLLAKYQKVYTAWEVRMKKNNPDFKAIGSLTSISPTPEV